MFRCRRGTSKEVIDAGLVMIVYADAAWKSRLMVRCRIGASNVKLQAATSSMIPAVNEVAMCAKVSGRRMEAAQVTWNLFDTFFGQYSILFSKLQTLLIFCQELSSVFGDKDHIFDRGSEVRCADGRFARKHHVGY